MLFDHPDFDDHHRVTWICDPETGLKAIHAIHRPLQGRSGGGTRFRSYDNELDALTDVLRLSKAMTYKMVLADIPIGGAKTVIIGDPAKLKTPALLAAFARYVDSLNGLYVCGPDIGTNADDMTEIARTTKFVAGRSDQSGTTALPTAIGGFNALKATAKAAFGSDDLAGLTVAVQGVGGVGAELTRMLIGAKAKVKAADVNVESLAQAEALGATIIPVEDILSVEADILSPNALGGILNDRSINTLRVRAICGCANNQLSHTGIADQLKERGILWAPDYVVSAGGAIDGCKDAGILTPSERDDRLDAIFTTLLAVFEGAQEIGTNTDTAARALAHERLLVTV